MKFSALAVLAVSALINVAQAQDYNEKNTTQVKQTYTLYSVGNYQSSIYIYSNEVRDSNLVGLKVKMNGASCSTLTDNEAYFSTYIYNYNYSCSAPRAADGKEIATRIEVTYYFKKTSLTWEQANLDAKNYAQYADNLANYNINSALITYLSGNSNYNWNQRHFKIFATRGNGNIVIQKGDILKFDAVSGTMYRGLDKKELNYMGELVGKNRLYPSRLLISKANLVKPGSLPYRLVCQFSDGKTVQSVLDGMSDVSQLTFVAPADGTFECLVNTPKGLLKTKRGAFYLNYHFFERASILRDMKNAMESDQRRKGYMESSKDNELYNTRSKVLAKFAVKSDQTETAAFSNYKKLAEQASRLKDLDAVASPTTNITYQAFQNSFGGYSSITREILMDGTPRDYISINISPQQTKVISKDAGNGKPMVLLAGPYNGFFSDKAAYKVALAGTYELSIPTRSTTVDDASMPFMNGGQLKPLNICFSNKAAFDKVVDGYIASIEQGTFPEANDVVKNIWALHSENCDTSDAKYSAEYPLTAKRVSIKYEIGAISNPVTDAREIRNYVKFVPKSMTALYGTEYGTSYFAAGFANPQNGEIDTPYYTEVAVNNKDGKNSFFNSSLETTYAVEKMNSKVLSSTLSYSSSNYLNVSDVVSAFNMTNVEQTNAAFTANH